MAAPRSGALRAASGVWRGWTLPTRVTAAVAALVLPLTVLILVSYGQIARERRAAEIENAAAVGQATAATVDAFARDLESTTLAAAIALGQRGGTLDQAAAGAYLRALSDAYGVLRGLFLLDPDGRVVASASGAGIGLDLAERPYMQALRGGTETVWGPGVRGIESGEVTVTFGRAVRGPDGAVRAYLVAAFYPPALVDRLRPGPAPDADVTLVDDRGLVLHSTARPGLPFEQRDVSGSARLAAARAGQVVRLDGETTLFGGAARYGALVPVPRTGWVLVFSRPLAPLEARLRAQLVQQAGGTALVVVLAAGCLALLARRLVEPITALAGVAAAVARGERPAVPDAGPDPEVAQLAAGMRAMGAAVAEREDALRFLADASGRLAASLDHATTLAAIADLAVPRVADWCAVYAVDEDGEPRRLAGAHADPARAALMRQLVERFPLGPDPEHPVRRAIRTGRTVVPPPVPPERVDRHATDAEHARILRELGVASAVVVPMVAAGRAVGALSFGPPERVNRALAEELAQRAAAALDNARLHRRAEEQAAAQAALNAALRGAADARDRALAAAEAAHRRVAFLAAASEALAGSLEYERTLARVAELAVPALADWCAVDLLEPDGGLRRVAAVHADAARAEAARRLAEGFPFIAPTATHTALRVARSGEPWFDPEVDEARFVAEARSPEHLALLRQLGFRGEIVVPLRARAGVLGTLTLVAGDGRPRYAPDDLTLAAELAHRCALAIENARLFVGARESEARYRAVVEQSADAIVVVEGTTAVYANAAYLRLLGVERLDEVIGRSGDRWVHPDDAPLVRERALARQRGEPVPPVYEFRVVRPGGEVRAVEVAASSITRGGRPATLAVLRDVTERKRAAEGQRLLAEASAALGASLDYEATLANVARLLVPALADWCTVYLREGDELHRVGVAHADPAGEELLQRLARLYPRRADRPDPVVRVVEAGEPLLVPVVAPEALERHAHDEEHRRLLRELAPRSAMIVPLVVRGEVLGALGLNRAAGRPAYRPEDLALAEELARRCAAAIDNARLYAEAQAAVRTRDRFLSVAAHELRTPLTSVRGAAQVLARAQARGVLTPETLERGTALIVQSADRLAGLISDLLDVSRLRTGQLALRPRPTDLGQLVRAVAAHHADRADGHALVVDVPDAACVATVDPDRLEEVFENLLDNAFKYSPAGGVVRIELVPGDGRATVRVSDQGIGLPPGAAESIFEPFGRAANAVQAHLPGMGLGLHICRGVVELHGGDIRAESPGEGRGTTVVVELPCRREGTDG